MVKNNSNTRPYISPICICDSNSDIDQPSRRAQSVVPSLVTASEKATM